MRGTKSFLVGYQLWYERVFNSIDVHNKSERPQNLRIQEQLGHDVFVLCRVKWNFRLLFSSAFVYRDKRWGGRRGGGGLLSVFLFKNNRWVSGCFCQVFFMVLNLLPFLSYMNYNLSLSLGFSFQEKYAEFN